MSDGPFVKAAFLCEKVLAEKDEVMSAIRIVDTMRFAVSEGGQLPPMGVDLKLVLMLITGAARGAHTLRIDTRSPSSQVLGGGELSISLADKDEGSVTFVAPVQFVTTEPGLHWFNIDFDGRRITRIPLTVERTVRPAV